MIEIYLRHYSRCFSLSFVLWHILEFHKSCLQSKLSDNSLAFNINTMKATNNRVLVFKGHYKIDHQHQDTQLYLRQLQSTKFSQALKNLKNTLMISISYDFFC